ncbi:MAG: patatin-like phospholipase family protein, partial [Burkholderiales bacterium]|nr:patatin-like phospholipase family protein [Burkholderiales bacterium]
RFLKRDVEGELLRRLFAPANWPSLWSQGWGRSELAADLYDEILFEGAAFADLQRRKGPLIVVTATDLSTGARVYFLQSMFDAMCADLGPVRLSRAAAASSAVPVVLSPVTLDNYGGTCGYAEPPLLRPMTEAKERARPAARAIERWKELVAYGDSARRPYIHLVDGGVSDNVAMRGVLQAMDELEALHMLGRKTPLDSARRIVVFVVNSLSSPSTHWDESVDAPNSFQILLQAASVPIDHYSFEAIELLRDLASRWHDLRAIRDSVTVTAKANPALAMMTRVPDAEIYVINVSFPALADKAEVAYLNSLPTSFVLPPEAVDRLRAAARTIVMQSPELGRFLRDRGERIVATPSAATGTSR